MYCFLEIQKLFSQNFQVFGIWIMLFICFTLVSGQNLGAADFSEDFMASQEVVGQVYQYDELLPVMVHSRWSLPLSQLWKIADKYLSQCIYLSATCEGWTNQTDLCVELTELHRQMVLRDPKAHFAPKSAIPLEEHLYEILHNKQDHCLNVPTVNLHELPYVFNSYEHVATWSYFCWNDMDHTMVFEACLKDRSKESFYQFGQEYLPDVQIDCYLYTNTNRPLCTNRPLLIYKDL